jgi:hypothetical protein
MNGRDKMAQALFDAVGMIDEEYIKEAADYKKNKKRKRLLRTVSLIAASLVVVTAIFIPLLIGLGSVFDRGGNASGSKMSVKTLKSGEKLAYDAAALIWQREGQTDYSYVDLSEAKAEKMIEYATKTPVAAKTETEIRVWIKLGSGEYVSPQLKQSVGNTGLDLFDFSPELELSDTIADIINNSESGNPK